MIKSLTFDWRLVFLIALALVVRLYRVTNPVADWHAFRQADTISVTREYVKHGIDILRPTYQDLSNIQSGFDNPQGYRMVEFPLINAVIASVVKMMPFLDLALTSRLFSIAASLGTLVCLYFLVKDLSDEPTALVTAGVFALLPYSIFYSRAILPEPFMLFFSTLAILGFTKWLKFDQAKWYVISLSSLIIALLLKPFVMFLGPLFLALSWQKWSWKLVFKWQLYVYGLLAAAPMFAWREWIKNFPEGIPVSKWLFNEGNLRLRPAWFRWLFWERLTKLFLGYAGILVLPFNLDWRQKDLVPYAAWWVGILAYFVVIAKGNVQHDYYQNLALPIICISVARGSVWLYRWLLPRVSQTIAAGGIGFILMLGWIGAWKQVGGYFNVNHWEYVRAGQAVDQLTPPDAKVIAPAMGDTQFLYQTNRTGWPLGFEIDDKISKGATHYVTTSMDDEANELTRKYTTLEKTPDYLLLDLRQPLASEAAAVANPSKANKDIQ